MDPQDALSRIQSATNVVCVGKRAWKDRPVAKLIAACALSVAVLASAAPASASTVIPSVAATLQRTNSISPEEAARTAPFVELGALDSALGEEKAAFMLRVARVLDAFTARTGHEGCGAVMETPEQDAWRVRLITNRSQVACVRVMFEEDGFLPTAETIHSHPLGHHRHKDKGKLLRVNAVDARLRGWRCGSQVKIFDDDFSPGDIENGSGYLVSRGRLLYLEEGDETGRLVGAIDRAAPLDRLTLSPKPYWIAPGAAISSVASSLPASPSVQVWEGSASGDGLPNLSCKTQR